MKILKIGSSFVLPICAGFDIDQRYEPIGGESILRACSGRGIKQMTYRKTRIITSGNGWVPDGIQSLDFTAQHALACVVAETIPASYSTRQATLPTTRRTDTDHTPFGLAQLADGQTIMSTVTITNNVAEVAAVSGATAYQVGYYPLLTCWINRPTKSGPAYAWEFVAEEV